MSISQTTYVQLSRREYDCLKCGEAHSYGEPIYEIHQEYARDYGRWIYEDVK